MSNYRKTKTGKIILSIAGLTMAVMMVFGVAAIPASAALTQSQVDAIVALLQSFGADQATIDNVKVSLTGGTPTTPTTPTVPSTACSFTRDLTIGSSGTDVTCLQDYLTGTGHFTFSGGSTGYFGSITKTAVAAWQADSGVSPAVGYFGSISRAKYNSLIASAPTTPTTPTTPTGTGTDTGTGTATGTGLSVSAPAQPSDGKLAVNGAARLPFSKVTLTAGSSDVVVTGVKIRRNGQAQDAAFSGIVLLDDNGTILGIAKTLNSNHEAVVGEQVTIPAGMSKTFTVAGNMASSLTSYAGQVAELQIIEIMTSATVTGTLPIVGAARTINSTLTIGSITNARGPLDPNTTASKEVGTTGYTFTALKVTNGSTEKVRLHSVRWNQASSAAASDLANVKTFVDGTAYPTVISSDGKYYSTSFGAGIVIDKGLNAEISIKADIVGGSGRTINFTIHRNTDLYITGETYGYGITPPTSGTGISSSGEWLAAYTVTISAGSIRVSQDTTLPSDNIAVNVVGQKLAGIKVKVDGEPISVQQIVFDIATSSTGNGKLTDVSLYDQNGAVVAGPVDEAATAAGSAAITFTDTVVFPIGENSYTVRGKVWTGATNGGTFVFTTNPATDWTSVTGQNTGDSRTPTPSGDQALQTMTVRAASLAISVSSAPVAQTFVRGGIFTFANYNFDATQSGEDVRFSSIPLTLENTSNSFSGAPNNLTSCQLFDGSVALNTGSNAVDPSGSATTSDTTPTFTFDSPFTVPKNTVKVIPLKCKVSTASPAGSQYSLGIAAAPAITVTGVTSGAEVTETVTASQGQIMTVAGTGTLTIVADTSTPPYTIAAAGASGVTLGVLKFHAANEAINLSRVALQLTNTASSSITDLTGLSLWDGGTKVGTAVFTSTRFATSTLTTAITVPKDGDKVLTVKGDLAQIGTSLPATQGALIGVNYDGNDSTGTRGVGAASGATIDQGSSSDTAFAGVRVFKSFPKFTKLPITPLYSNEAGKDLYKFSITADSAGSIGIYKFTFYVSTSSGPLSSGATTTITNFKMKAYTDSLFSSAVGGFTETGAAGQLNNTIATTAFDSGTTTLLMNNSSQGTGADYLQIPAGATYYFLLEGDVTVPSAVTTGSITVGIEGDHTYPTFPETGNYQMSIAASTTVLLANHTDFIWSPNATTSSLTTHSDWTNGYFVPGLPSDNMDRVSFVK